MSQLRLARSRVRSVQSRVRAEPSPLRKSGSKRRNAWPGGSAVPTTRSGKVSARRREPRERSTDQSRPRTTCTTCKTRSSARSPTPARRGGVPSRLSPASAPPWRAVVQRRPVQSSLPPAPARRSAVLARPGVALSEQAGEISKPPMTSALRIMAISQRRLTRSQRTRDMSERSNRASRRRSETSTHEMAISHHRREISEPEIEISMLRKNGW